MEVYRRKLLALIASATVTPPARADGGLIIHLSAESEEIIQLVIDSGRHDTRQEVVDAAMDMLMKRTTQR